VERQGSGASGEGVVRCVLVPATCPNHRFAEPFRRGEWAGFSARRFLPIGWVGMDRFRLVPPLKQKTYDLSEDFAEETPRSILLVEDDAAFADILKTYLETYDHSVTIAVDGVQGMKRVMEKDFDVIICDLLMPNLPGDMFYIGVERVKPALAKRFIFITGHQNDPKVSEFVKKVRALTLFKPFEMHLLLETIRAALKNGRKAS
jgi:CheY-like chemotaxis protein